MKRTIVEAAVEALLKIGRAATLDEIYSRIVEDELYVFGAKSPVSVLRVTMDRHCFNKAFSKMSKERFFSKSDSGEYHLLRDVSSFADKSNLTPQEFDALTSSEEVDSLIEQIQDLAVLQREKVKAEILSGLRLLTPEDFERFCRIFLARYGFTRMELTRKGRDGGIDVRGLLKVGLAEMRVAVQCKRYGEDNKIGRPSVSAFRGDITGEFEQGIFITTSGFTKEAQDISFKPGCVPVILIDGEQLTEIMIDKGVGVQRQMIDVFDFDSELLLGS